MKANIKNSISCLIVVVVPLLLARCIPHEVNLLDLQKKILTAQTASERQAILDRLDRYYLEMEIPDSIRQQVEADANMLIEQQPSLQPGLAPVVTEANAYDREIQLKDLLRGAMIARVRSDEAGFQGIIRYASQVATAIDSVLDSNYWRHRVAQVESLAVDQAKAWLLADRAEARCKAAPFTGYVKAEQYGALGLQLLRQVPDARLELDLVQRLLTILTECRGMYDLGYPLALRALLKADELGYRLRATGICYNYANALYLAGQNQLALQYFQESIARAEQYRQVPQISWYKRNGLLGTAKANWQLGNYESALRLCHEIEKFQLADRESSELCNTKGMIHRSLGNYDQAEAEYQHALKFALSANDVFNQIYILQNLGTLYHRMTDYDRAIEYYHQAMGKLLTAYPQNLEMKIGLLLCILETKLEQQDNEQFNERISDVNQLIEQVHLPSLKAELLRSTGRINMKARKFEDAYRSFRAAIELYENYKWRRAALETKTDLAESLIGMSKYQAAREHLNSVYREATRIQDAQHRIEAMGMLAIVAQQQGDLDKAIQLSNQFLREFDWLSTRFSDVDTQTRFRQKVNDYLKNAVQLEIAKGRVDSAFVKLDYIKARASKDRLGITPGQSTGDSNSHLINIKQLQSLLKPNSLVISYLVATDALYAFVLDHQELLLFKKEVTSDEIKGLVAAFMNAITESIEVFQNEQPVTFVAHYDTVAARSQRLYRALLDWRALQSKLDNSEISYVIPDDVLHGIPFACLMNPDPEAHQFLTERTAVVNLPSAFSLRFTTPGKNGYPTNANRVLISADREFPGAAELVTSIKKQFPRAEELVINKPVISKDDILSKLREPYQIYFFIGHSEANLRMPNLSQFDVVAAQKADSSQTRVGLNLTDFKSLDWSQADMVFLIGCETAAGKLFKGSGFDSFQQCFLFRGAKCVLASRWRIDARETIDQIAQFLHLWRASQNPSLALREVGIQAIQRLRQDPYFKKPHPFLWGSYALAQTIN